MFTCSCGRTTMADAPHDGSDQCPFCGTFPAPGLGETLSALRTNYRLNEATGEREPFQFTVNYTGHRYWPAGDDGLRCFDCDGRPHSHPRYPGDSDFEWYLERADKAWTAMLESRALCLAS